MLQLHDSVVLTLFFTYPLIREILNLYTTSTKSNHNQGVCRIVFNDFKDFKPFFSCFSRFSGKYITSFQGLQFDCISYKALRFEFFKTEIHVRKFQSIKTIYSRIYFSFQGFQGNFLDSAWFSRSSRQPDNYNLI